MKSAACPFRYFLHRRQRAKSLRLDGEDRIELAAEVLQSNDGGELHQFFFRKMALETVEETFNLITLAVNALSNLPRRRWLDLRGRVLRMPRRRKNWRKERVP